MGVDDPLSQADEILKRQADSKRTGRLLKLTDAERDVLKRTEPARARRAQCAALRKKLSEGKPLSASQLKFLEEAAESGAQTSAGPKLYSVNAIARETGIDRRTIEKRLAHLVPASYEDLGNRQSALYSGPEAFSAVLKAPDQKRNPDHYDRWWQARANREERKDAIEARQVIPAELVLQAWSAALVDLRQKISFLELPPEKKAEILNDLREIPVDEYFRDIRPDSGPETQDPGLAPEGAAAA